MVPKVEFETSRVVNEFCHLSVLYSELMPPELASGILQNKTYLERHRHLRQDAIQLELQKTRPFASESEWYTFATGLMKRDQSRGFQSSSNSQFAEIFQDLSHRRAMGFDEIWKETRPRLVEYQYNFASQWAPISDKVLSRLSELSKTHWSTDKIHVHFIDCLYGGFGWNDCIGFAAFPDIEVQKKFIAHELSELITSQRIVGEELRKAGLDPGIAHTVVDMLAYFSVRDSLVKPVFPNSERKGIRPNPNYYPCADVLFPIFERYAEDPWVYPNFRAFLQDMVLGLPPQTMA